MSALAGLWSFDGARDAAEACERMLVAQALYGPHHAASWSRGDVAVGRRLYRLLPEDIHDRQPLVVDERLALVADLRLDNREDLEAVLGIEPDQARRLCDADLLLAAWRRWDEDCFDRLVGDYAFALWDGEAGRLILARDPLGQRPLHYHRGSGFCAFASMPKGLHALADIAVAPDEERMARFVALMPEAGSRSYFEGIERVEPGGVVTLTRHDLATRKHWKPARRTMAVATPDDYAAALRGHLDTAVRARLRGAGGAIGAHLSAGWDSTAVAATAARLLARSGGRVVAFTATPPGGWTESAPSGRLSDEGPMAALTAGQHANMEHVLVRSTSRSPIEDLDREAFLHDRPTLNPCNAVWINDINRSARARGITVMLTGALGNAALSYNGLEWIAELAARGLWRRWLREARALARVGTMSWRGILANSFGARAPGPLWSWLKRLRGTGVGEVTDHTAIHPARLAALDLGDHDFHHRPGADTFASRLRMLSWGDPGNHNKGVLGGWGVDLRDPTADRRLIEFCLSLPGDQLLSDGDPRALSRAALADRLPQAVLSEPAKGYQGADWGEGLTAGRGELAMEVERLASCAPAARVLDLDKMRRLVEAWPSGGWDREAVIEQYRCVLLRGVSAGHFLRKTSGANR